MIRQKKIILGPMLIWILILGCSPANQNRDSSEEKVEREGYATQKDTLIKEQPDQVKPKGLTHTVSEQVLKIFKAGDTTIFYERPFRGKVIRQSGQKTRQPKGLYHVYLSLTEENDIIVVCEENKPGALLEVLIPDSVSSSYEDFHSGGIHSRSPSGKFIALDFGTGTDRLLRIYDLDDQKEIASVSYHTAAKANWDIKDRLAFYGRGQLPDSLLTSVNEELVSDSYTTILYEKIWSDGQIDYTGNYKKITQE